MKVPNHGVVYEMQGLILLLLLTPHLAKLIFHAGERPETCSPGLRWSLPGEDRRTQTSLVPPPLDGPLFAPGSRQQHGHRAHTQGHYCQEITTSRQGSLTCLPVLEAELEPSSKDLAFQLSACS